ncbi:ABC transporter ATP-binding protein [Fodinicurvata fenggangensis]|uniref:ABC transporter ATP-binding protein n=1 Tax=Fodinicurvata fenggangensis TaxID=1121830 RepID=UPI00068C1C2E|nr:ABC transporter ATP-binding protein [Fodinicurvata fenggangensis]
MTSLLEVQGLKAWYGRAQVLFDVALEVKTGEVVALLGPNGSGKSTTLKAIMGLVTRSAERMQFDGQEIAGLAEYQIARQGIGYVPEDRRVFQGLTVRENLSVAQRPPQNDRVAWSLDGLFSLFPKLEQLYERRAGEMSGGEQQMLTIARTLMGNPRLLLLDEPSEGLAPVVVQQMRQAILSLKQEGLTVLLSEQNPAFAEGLIDRSYRMDRGRALAAGKSAV